jgi:peptidoglycan glycosyltransferase (EC 2.4.1.129)
MRGAVVGTAYGATCRGANLPDIEVCGKTGTAQNKGKDHSIFMGFAPMNKPKIAIAVYVENAGFGATWAVPIASVLMEKYLKGTLSPERMKTVDEISNTNLIQYGFKEY